MAIGLHTSGREEPDGFTHHGYAVVRGAISRADARRYEAYALMNRQHPDYYRDVHANHEFCRDADVLAESVLGALQTTIEGCTGLALMPCTASLRIYTRGAQLARRKDPPYREISAVLALGGQGEQTWPMWLNEADDDKAVVLPPGDLLVYRGSELPHWRETLEGEYWAEMCLRYVSAGGQFTHHRFDGRRVLGEPLAADQQSRCIELRQDYDAALAAGEDRPCFCESGSAYSSCHGMMVSTPGA